MKNISIYLKYIYIYIYNLLALYVAINGIEVQRCRARKKVRTCLSCIFICFFNFKREKSKLHFCLCFYLVFNYSVKFC